MADSYEEQSGYETPPEGAPPPEYVSCAYHPQYLAAGYCAACGKSVCAQCLEASEGRQLCPVCAVTAPKPERSATATATVLGIALGVVVLCAVVLVVLGPWRQLPVPPPPLNQMEAPAPPNAIAEEPPWADLPADEVHPETPGPLLPQPEVKPEPKPEPPALVKPPPGPSPRERAALEAALAEHSGWAATVKWHNADWSEARVWVGPKKGRWELSLALAWDKQKQAWEVMDEGPAEE